VRSDMTTVSIERLVWPPLLALTLGCGPGPGSEYNGRCLGSWWSDVDRAGRPSYLPREGLARGSWPEGGTGTVEGKREAH